MQKKKKINWKRPTAAVLAAAIAAANVDLSQFGFLTSYAFSRDYGVCTDNHLYSSTGANCNTDIYAPLTKPTQNLTHGSEDWKSTIEYNKQILLQYIGNGDARTVLKTLWSTIATITTAGLSGGMDPKAVQEAEFWAGEIQKNIRDSVENLYYKPLPTRFSPITETELGIVRHGAAGEAIIQRDPLLAALCDYDHLFPGKGQSIANEPGQGWPFDAHWLMPKMGTGWLESYTVDQYGEGSTAQWPTDTQNHYIEVKDGDPITVEMVQQAALAIDENKSYQSIGQLDDKLNLIRDTTSSGNGSSSDTGSGSDNSEDDTSTVTKSDSNHYYINMSQWFINNASVLKVWNGQAWQSIMILHSDPVQVNGWTLQPHLIDGKTAPYIEVTYNGSGTPQPLYAYFEIPKGSFVSKENTTWDSPLDFAADIMEVYKCADCPSHRRPVDDHQIFIKLHELQQTNSYPCIKIGGVDADPVAPETDQHFCVFRHQEDWQTDYNVQLDKKDYETGEPLENAVFSLYEKFDDKERVNTLNDGDTALYEGSDSGTYPDSDWQSGYTSSPVLWDNFRQVGSFTTDADGHIETDVPKNYHYEKTYCDGHPAPVFVEVPDLVVDPVTQTDNSDEVEAAKNANRAAANKWIGYYEACQEKAQERQGVHFHWLGDGVLEGEIRDIAVSGGEEGETPDGGPTACFEKEKSYESSGCKQDTEDTYDKFISLQYTYTWKEDKAREGYIQHDTHTDDVLIEAITTDASQNGANSTFAIGNEKYDADITINNNVASLSADKDSGSESVTLLQLMTSAFPIGNGYEDDVNADYEMEPVIREDYDFDKSGFSALKENILESIKFITGYFENASTASDSNAEDAEDADETDDNDTEIPDIDLFGDVDQISGRIKDAVKSLFVIDAYAAATPSNSENKKASVSKASETARSVLEFSGLSADSTEDEMLDTLSDDAGSGAGFEEVFKKSFTDGQTDTFAVKLGPDDNWSHCDDRDGEGNAWRVYDHRTEGEIHFNKRDLYLNGKDSDQFDSYAQENGDGTLEGAVYGLFADEDIVHPDGKTGTVYKEGNLVAVATTDRNGDGSFMAYTEAPGMTYNYKTGNIEKTAWYNNAPTNRFRESAKAEEENTTINHFHDTDWTVDDYTDDAGEHIIPGRTERLYDDNEGNNTNAWIGRPLILGKYYIKELSRSEGYELSVNGKANAYTNYDPENPDAVFEENREEAGKGKVSVSRNLYINGQESIGEENEPFFQVTAEGTAENSGFDIVVSKLPQGTKFYRQDTNVEEETRQQQTGWQVVNKTDANGNIIYKKAESDYSDPIYVGDGSYNTEKENVPVTIGVSNVAVRNKKIFDQDKVDAFLRGNAATDATGAQYYPDQVRLSKAFDASDWRFIKAKLETAIRGGSGMITPSQYVNGKKTYTDENYSVYSRGIRKGETDTYGVSGVTPGEPAKQDVYGPQIVKVTVEKTVNGQELSQEDMIRNLIQYYIDHPCYNFGGLDHYEENADSVDFFLYASDAYTTNDAFAIRSENGDGFDIYVRKPFMPDDTSIEPYYVFVKYTEDGSEEDAFGYYTNFNAAGSGSFIYVSALCTPDAAVNGDGTITSRTIDSTKYYKKGETVHDKDGNKIPETERVPKYEDVTVNVLKTEWTQVDAAYDPATGNHVIHVSVPYTDAFGNVHTDAGTALDIAMKAVCPKTMHTLTQDDIDAMSAQEQYRFNPGDEVVSGLYEVDVLKAKASVYLDYAKKQAAKQGSYIADIELTYPGQEKTFQDGDGAPGHGSILTPISVQERPIRQKVKVFKDIQTLAEPKSVWYCLNCGYENADGETACGYCGHERTTEETKLVKYAHDTYSAVHSENLSAKRDSGLYSTAKDWLTKLMHGENENEAATDIPNFRFKAYLRSNLERLYRDKDGNITWMDRNGNTMTPEYQDTNGDGNYDTFTWKYDSAYDKKTVDFPEKEREDGNALDTSNVQKIYTAIPHEEGSKTTSARANNVWAEYNDPQHGGTFQVGEKEGYTTSERADANGQPGDPSGNAVDTSASLYQYNGKNQDTDASDRINNTEDATNSASRLLETTRQTMEDGNGTREVEVYNYEKFFDAIAAANTDIWDDDMHSTYTGAGMDNDPGQHWFETFYEKYQKDDADMDHTAANTDGKDADNTAGGDRDTSFKPFRWIREQFFGSRSDYEAYPAQHNGANTEVGSSTSDYAKANAQASDAVRQFAVKWYLKQEVAKLQKDNGSDEDIAEKDNGTIGYDEAVYDQALFEAIAKSYNYLRPFYRYDLDTIYSVEWDSAENGGTDNDYTTLSIDNDDGDEHSNVSSYLPYGIYVIVEQQPERRDGNVNDWENRSYTIEKPKEVLVPSVYDVGESNDTTDNYHTHYDYDAAMSTQTQARSDHYLIRFGEEWSDDTPNAGQDERQYVIRAHGYYGDYEIYKYGLDIDLVNNTERRYDGIHYGDIFTYAGWRYTQSASDPLKDYYNTEHRGEEGVTKIGTENGGNDASDYMAKNRTNGADTANGGNYDAKPLQDRFYYAGISEDSGVSDDVMYKDGQKDNNNASGMHWKDHVISMTGELTAYNGRYAQMLVPWSVTEPADTKAYSAADFCGYADVNMRDGFFTTFLRINKTDSETGEYILHDDAIFALYAGSRYQTFDEIKKDAKLITDPQEQEMFLKQFKPGDTKFYLQDTQITGTKEFLEAMGAHDITPAVKGRSVVESGAGLDEMCTGIVPKGTPICLESEKIMLTDQFGNRTGQLTAYTTMNDVEVASEEDPAVKEYINQNTGYFITPQPVGAGVYVLTEIKAPAGYARSKPVAYEVYSDNTSYYVDGDMYSKVAAVRYQGNLITDINYTH